MNHKQVTQLTQYTKCMIDSQCLCSENIKIPDPLSKLHNLPSPWSCLTARYKNPNQPYNTKWNDKKCVVQC